MSPRFRIAADAAIVCAVLVLCSMWATRYWDVWIAQGNQPHFYQENFEPSVMIACGRGFVVSAVQPAALADFLEQRRDTFSCSDIPAGTKVTPSGSRMIQRPWFYLMWFVGLAWRVLGISWRGMGPAFGVLFGLSAALVYGLCRLAMGRVLALVAVAGISTSTIHLVNMPHLRDFAKEPFTLALFLIIGLLVTRPVRPRWVVGFAVLYGVVLAVAYGFRTDFLIDIPLLVIVLALFLEGGPLRHIKVRLAACAAFAAAFVVVGWPMIASVYREGGCQWHTVFLGLTEPFDRYLVVQPAPYEFGYLYNDAYADDIFKSFAARTEPGHPQIRFCSAEYDVESGRYFRMLIAAFPADFMTRGYASARSLAQEPFLTLWPPVQNWMAGLFAARDAWLRPLRRSGVWLVAAATLLAAASSLRLGLFLLVFALFVGGYPALQFAPRHFFHLEFAVWWAFGFVAQRTINAAWTLWRTRAIDLQSVRGGAVRMATMAACAAAILVLPLLTLRAYQTTRVTSLFTSYVAAAKVKLDPSPAAPDGAVFLASRSLGRFDGDLIEVDIDRERCGEPAGITFKYEPASASPDFTHAVTIPRTAGSPGPTRVFLAVFEYFKGVQIPASMAGCVAGAYRLSDPATFPLLVDATLPPGWEHLPLYQRLAGWEPHWID